MAQAYEIEAYLGDQWDAEETASLVEQIQATGSDDGDVWMAVTLRHDGVTIRELVQEREQARMLMEERARQVRAMTLLALAEDPAADKTALARAARVSRPTIYSWAEGAGA